MDISYISSLLNPFITSISNKQVRSAFMYAFKTKPIVNGTNTLRSLDYEFFDTSMKKAQVTIAIENILNIFNSKYLSKEETVFQEYTVNNPKKVIDYISLSELDFNTPSIQQGTEQNIDSNNYKIKLFLNSLKTNCQVATNEKDYNKFKHSALELTTSDNKTITIINKVAPIYKPKGWLYIFNPEDIEDDTFKLLDKKLFRLPLYPHIIIVDNICLLIEPNVESIFGFEKYNKQLCKNTLNKLKITLPVQQNSFDIIKSFSEKGRNFNLFSNFNNNRLENIKNKDAFTHNFLKDKMKLNFDALGNIIITNDQDAEKLVLYLCNCIFQDIELNSLVEAKNSKPL